MLDQWGANRLNPRMNQNDYEFTTLDEEGQKLKLDQHKTLLKEANAELFNAKHAMMREGERLKALAAKGIRHKNKMHKFYDRVESARNYLEQLEENPLTYLLKGMQDEPTPVAG